MIHYVRIIRTRHLRHVAEHPGLGLLLLLVAGLVQAAFGADDPSMFTTHQQQTVTNTVTDASGRTSRTTGTTSTSNTTTRDAHDRHDAWRNNSSDARKFPHNATDRDTARKGFDDPRDGRYNNDDPDHHPGGDRDSDNPSRDNEAHLQGVVVNSPSSGGGHGR